VNTSGTSISQGTGSSLQNYPEQGLGIGANLTQPSRQLDGTIVEVQIFDEPLSADQRAVVEQELLERYFVAPDVEESIGELVGDVEDIDLPNGLETALTSKLQNALESYQDGNLAAAINKLQAFINQVEAKRGNGISEEDADALIAAAEAIISQIEAEQ
jgi:hypothetical protein